MSIAPLIPLNEVTRPDSFWIEIGRSLEAHHERIAEIELKASVPDPVRQHFENARNAWLYAYFAYRLLSVSLVAVHIAAELAVKLRAQNEQVKTKGMDLEDLMDLALDKGWVTDEGFQLYERLADNWERDRQLQLELGQPDIGPYAPADDPQAYSRVVLQNLRKTRNSLAHGETLLMPNVDLEFLVVRDLINQLF